MPRHGVTCLLVAALFTTLGGNARAQPTIHIARVSEPPRLDDYVNGTPPPGATRAITEFSQREPGDGVPASQQTAAYLSYDDDHLYVVFVCHDEQPDQGRARRTRREGFTGQTSLVTISVCRPSGIRQGELFVSILRPRPPGLRGLSNADPTTEDAEDAEVRS